MSTISSQVVYSATTNGGVYGYDAMNRRASRTVTSPASATTLYVHDISNHIIAETNTAGQTLREYIWLNDLPVAVVDNVNTASPALYYVHSDHLGRPARMTAQNQSWAWDVIYDPFGNVSYSWSNPEVMNIRFPGQWFQLETGLAYNWHRHYDATLGRYVQPDPLGLKALTSDGPSAYGYVGGNPLNHTDASGLRLDANFDFFYDWLSGYGPNNRNYFGDDFQTREMQNGAGAEVLRNLFYDKNCRNVDKVSYSTWHAFRDTILHPGDTAFQVGGWGGAMAVNNGDGTVTFTIPNTAGTHSFFYHLVPDLSSPTGPMSNINQTFIWTEQIPNGKCGCQ